MSISSAPLWVALVAGASAAIAQPAPSPGEVPDKGAVRMLPVATAPCPELRDGDVRFRIGTTTREVRLFLNLPLKPGGPLVFAWHQTLGGPTGAAQVIGKEIVDQIRSEGGIVVAPYSVSREMRPWDSTGPGSPNSDDDQRLMDEVVACAVARASIDSRRIHSVGFSAGGLKSAQVSLRRSGYIASVVVYSGGLRAGDQPPDQDPENKFAAMILFGGPADISPLADRLSYPELSRNYRDLLRSQGRFAFLCDHDEGHRAPSGAQKSAWRFLQDHPYGIAQSPYRDRLPTDFPSYCGLQ